TSYPDSMDKCFFILSFRPPEAGTTNSPLDLLQRFGRRLTDAPVAVMLGVLERRHGGGSFRTDLPVRSGSSLTSMAVRCRERRDNCRNLASARSATGISDSTTPGPG